jgi:hypothetical protein
MLYIGTLACSIAAVNPAAPPRAQVQAQPVLGPMLPQFSVVARAPAYSLNSNCSMGGGAITFHLTVSNTGSAASPAITQDQGGVMISTALPLNGHAGSLWSVAAALPAIPAHGSVPADVTLMPLSNTTLMSGNHVFSALVNAVNHVKTASTAGNTTNISVSVPAGFCPNIASASAGHLAITKLPAPTVSPGTTQGSTQNATGSAKSNIGHVLSTQVQLPPVISAPTNLKYTNDPSVCNAHAGGGLASALICPGLIASTTSLPLVWDWQQCTFTPANVWLNTPSSNVCGVSQPDGFHVYRITNTVSTSRYMKLGTRTLVDTQTTPSMTIRGISPYNKTDCYVVTAYKGSTESPDSNEWCGAANLAMGTAWKEVTPAADTSEVCYAWVANNADQWLCQPSLVALSPPGCPPDNNGPYPSSTSGQEGIVKYHGQYPMGGDCSADVFYHASYKFDLSAMSGITKVIFVAYFTQETVYNGWNSLDSWASTTTTSYPCAITGLVNTADRSSVLPLTSNSNGVTVDITHFFAAGKVVTVGFAHSPDPGSANVEATCLTAFKDAHIDVTYFP